MDNLVIRPVRAGDISGLRALWRACRLLPSPSDTDPKLEEAVRNLEGLFLIAERGGATIGSVMGSFDGRRGWINRLAVHPDTRGEGLGTRLLEEVERALVVRGCDKINLLIERQNAAAETYYQRHGFSRDDLIFMEKWVR